jgi:hypothetical protein
MRSMTDVAHLIDNSYAKQKNHFRHADGVAPAPELQKAQERFARAIETINSNLKWRVQTDQAWVVCLCQAGTIPREAAKVILNGLEHVLKEHGENSGGSLGEKLLINQLVPCQERKAG